MKLTRKNNERTLTITRNEMLEIARRHNEAFYFDTTEFYDIDEIKANCPDKMVIDESMIGDIKEGFWMYKEDFWNLFKVHTEESDDCTDGETEFYFYDYKNHKRIK